MIISLALIAGVAFGHIHLLALLLLLVTWIPDVVLITLLAGR